MSLVQRQGGLASRLLAVASTDLIGTPCLVSLPQEVGKRIGIFEDRDSYSVIYRVSHESGDPRNLRKASGQPGGARATSTEQHAIAPSMCSGRGSRSRAIARSWRLSPQGERFSERGDFGGGMLAAPGFGVISAGVLRGARARGAGLAPSGG